MIPLGGDGPTALAIMWALAAITLSFAILRLITRQFIIQQLGNDDFVYTLAAIFFLLYVVFLQVSLRYGFGQSISDIMSAGSLQDVADAIYWEMIGQTFAVLGMAISKISLGLFLLRIFTQIWHRVVIWAAIIGLMLVSVATAVLFWVQCVPVRAIYDVRLRPTASCDIQITPFAVTLGVCCIIADFFFAIFPLALIWGLNMKREKKAVIAASMSLGIIAGGAGIVRTYEVASGFTENYTKDTVPLIIWSAVELAVTMICIGIPILRPLYQRALCGSGLSSHKYYKSPSENIRRMTEFHELRNVPKDSRAEGVQPQQGGSNNMKTTAQRARLENGDGSGVTDIESGSQEYILGPEIYATRS
ncbi:hypothetical protein CLIM01_14595 [Colletotrichum limetticola]|uniref:Rhodopsin domain-containing protein n=1 Tax=Colletotrichum limetticola TaxID=1209924 RepID=A0ABQ9P7F9_9PEZI|nr:hypothetical protein CLIM01_14595 [Colletotrichum limetticola]